MLKFPALSEGAAAFALGAPRRVPRSSQHASLTEGEAPVRRAPSRGPRALFSFFGGPRSSKVAPEQNPDDEETVSEVTEDPCPEHSSSTLKTLFHQVSAFALVPV